MESQQWNELQHLAVAVLRDGDDAWARFWMGLQPILEQWVGSPTFLGRISQREDYCRDIVILAWEKLQHNDYGKLRAFFKHHEGTPGDCASQPPRASAFGAWIFRVFKNLGIDYMRRLPEFVRRPEAGRKAAQGTAPEAGEARRSGNPSDEYWRSVVTLQTGTKLVTHSLASAATVRHMLEFLDQSVSRRQRLAARLHGEGVPVEQIARAMGVHDVEDARRIVQRSLDRLLYRRALELWSQNLDYQEVAQELSLASAERAYRMVTAAKDLLKRHFRN